jgi:benzoate/toluate 1,2-dioxygenase subunit beta
MVSDAEQRAATAFLSLEARLADEARYAEWLALWTDDAVYWVPATTDPAADPDTHLSHVYDNRARLETPCACSRPATARARSRPRACAGSSRTSR